MLLDSHVHIRGFSDDLTENLALHEELRINANMEAVNVLSLPQWGPEDAYQNVICLLFKALYPHNYCYFGFDYFLDDLDISPDARLEQVKAFMAMGFDGMKVIEGKPSHRKMLGRSFLAGEFSKAFAYLEEHNTPILWHVADPEEMWDRSKCNDYVIQMGWCYDSPEFMSKEEHINEALDMLNRFPNLNVTFAHFMFSAFNIDIARDVMEQYPKVCFDVTPGIEMYEGFDRSPTEWREFFIKYQDRIVFGTDNGWGDTETPEQKVINGISNINFIKDFLSTTEVVEGYNKVPVKGFALPTDVLEKIYYSNFKRRKNSTPNTINAAGALKYAEELLKKIKNSDKQPEYAKKRAEGAYEMLLATQG